MLPSPPGSLSAMPDDGEATAPPADGRIFSAYGVASAALGALCIAAVALGAAIWSAHRDEVAERSYQSRVLQTAADWTGVLINMTSDNVDASLQRLHDGTVGELNADFDAAVRPYREVVQRLKSRSTGRIEAVAIESVHHDPDAQPRARPSASELPPVARRTDTVMVVATSVAENVGGKPQTVHWNLRLDVSDVDGKLLISQLGSIR
ncbi:membrane protein [Mycobacterium heckeshornense]|nr:membrane protein [Mycobacterium heckeshornense]